MRILITGVSGLSGSIIAKKMIDAGHDVLGVSRRVTEKLNALISRPGFELLNIDINNISEYLKNIGTIDAIIHSAATSPASGVTNDKMVRDNINATQSLISSALKLRVKSFIFFSSISIYGEVSTDILDENTPIINPSVYGITKSVCERLLKENESELPSICLRLPGVLGPGAHRNWLASVADNLFTGRLIPIYNPDGAFNNAVHIDDIGNLVERTLEASFRGCHSIVLGARGKISIRNAILSLARSMERVPNLKYIESERPKFILSSKRAMENWGYDPMDIGQLLDRYGKDYISNSEFT